MYFHTPRSKNEFLSYLHVIKPCYFFLSRDLGVWHSFKKKTLTLQVTLQQLVLELCYKYITQDFENVKNFVNNFSTVTAIAFILHMSIFL